MRRRVMTLETLLEAYIHQGPRTIRDLRAHVAELNREAVPRIERALQRLRTQSRVRLVGRLWAHPTIETCSQCAGTGWAVSAAVGTICTACSGAGWIKTESAEDPAHVDIAH